MDIQFPLVQHMNKDDLQAFLDDDEKVNLMVADNELVTSKKQEKEMIIVESQSIADFNLSNESSLQEGRQRLLNLHEENRQIRAIYETNKRKLDEYAGKYSLEAAQKILETSATKQEEDSEEIADNFMNGEMSVDDFLQAFQICRHNAHMQRIKADKMNDLIGQLKKRDFHQVTSPPMTARPAPPVPAPRESPIAYRSPVYQNVPPPLRFPKPPLAVPRNMPMYRPGVPQGQVMPPQYGPQNGGIQYY